MSFKGSVLSPELLNLYIKILTRDISNLEGIKFGERNIKNLRYANDTAVVADSEEKLKCLVQTLVQASEERGLRLNISKSKVMVTSKRVTSTGTNIVIDGRVSEQVEYFKYLGSVTTQDRRCKD